MKNRAHRLLKHCLRVSSRASSAMLR
jgi:hypothetical protein